MWYSPKLFKQFNLQPPKTMEDFFRVAEVFKSNGIPALALVIMRFGRQPTFLKALFSHTLVLINTMRFGR